MLHCVCMGNPVMVPSHVSVAKLLLEKDSASHAQDKV
jgi:hypothetical protein